MMSRVLLLVPFLALLAAPHAAAQTPMASTTIPAAPSSTAPVPAEPSAAAAPEAAPPTVPATPGVSPAEAQNLLDTLNDPQRRAAFTATLEAMVRANQHEPGARAPHPAAASAAAASAPAAASPPAAARAEPPAAPAAAKPATPAAAVAAAVPLAPDSLGAQVIKRSVAWFADLGDQVSAFSHVLGNLPSVWAFTEHTMRDPARRARAIDTGWHLGLVLLVAIGVDILMRLLLRRPVRAVARQAPDGAAQHAEPGAAFAVPPPGAADTEDEAAPSASAEHRRFTRTIRVLRRLPYMLLRLMLDIMPVLAFAGAAWVGMQFCRAETQAVLIVAIMSYAVFRLAVVGTQAITSPDYRSLRIVHLSDQGAAYAVVWVRRLFLVGAAGYAASTIGVEFGMPNAAREAFMKAVALVDHIFLVIIVLQCRRTVAEAIRGHATQGHVSLVRRRLAAMWHLWAIALILAMWLVWAAQVRNGYNRLAHVFAVSAAVLVAARLIGIVALGALDRSFRIAPETASRYPGLEARANRYYPVLRGTLTTALTLAALLALLQFNGVNTLLWFRGGALGGQLFSAVLTVVIAGAVAVAVWEIANASLERHLAKLTKDAQLVRSARLRTLMPIMRTVLLLALGAVFGLTVLSEIGVNIAPLLAGAGILGVALGFGSQKLVQDFITGIFLLLENAMQVGDWVTVAGLSGSVENLSIRTMRLRAGDGSVHIIPFSSVSTVTNVNRGIGNAAVSVTVPVAEDTDHVCDVLTDIAHGMRAERRFADMMRSDLQLWGVDKVENGTVTIAGQIVCSDSGRWGVQREFNRRMTIRFKQEGIRIATPTSTVFQHAVPPPVAKQQDTHDETPQVTHSPPPAALGNTT